MKRKLKGPKYRNLYAWRGGIWYERVVAGRRFPVNTDMGYGRRFPGP